MKTMKPQNYELIIDKLRKILALRDAGHMGEAGAAEAALNRLCKKYGISMDEIMDAGEKKKRVYFKGVSDNSVKNILFACYFKVTKQTIEDFNEAFIITNHLYSDAASEPSDKPLSPEEMARIRRIFNISMTIDPTPIPRKMIETR